LSSFDDAIEIDEKFPIRCKSRSLSDDNILIVLAEKYRKDRDWAVEMVDNMTEKRKKFRVLIFS
jgi:hypothetical protein